MRKLLLRLTALAAALVLALAGLSAWIVRGLYVPAGVSQEQRSFVIPAGEAFSQVVRRLESEGLLPQRIGFGPAVVVAYAQLRGLDRAMKSGEYALAPALSPVEILEKISEGKIATRPVTLPEGLNVWEIGERIEGSGIAAAREIVELAFSPEFAAELDVSADSLEGYLYPETYRFERGTDPRAILRAMVELGRERWTEDDLAALQRSGRSRHEVITLASIVEKETGVAEERPVIAAVFLNRLRRNMRLQSDPTVIYGILREQGSFNGNLTKDDLQKRRPYNTYRMDGIPPGPIASVGIESIRAVLSPAQVSYLYFVSRNDGTHQFSNTLVEHNRAVIKYQKGGRP